MAESEETNNDDKKQNPDAFKRLVTTVKNRIKKSLQEEIVPVAFPPSSDVLLSLIKYSSKQDDAIDKFFMEYFNFEEHRVFRKEDDLGLEGGLTDCLKDWDYEFPPDRCVPGSCITLLGQRENVPNIRRLFIGDLIWLFYFERMGIFQMLGAIVDDFATNGKYPIPNDDHPMIVLESMVREMKSGLSSTIRDRDSTYRRALGWTSNPGRKLGLKALCNTAFSDLFHKFIQLSLDYYRDKRLAVAITKTTRAGVSVATLATIGDTLKLLKDAFEPFKYGRNYYNTLAGIVWCISGMTVIRDLRYQLGIPESYDKPQQFIPAAYDILIARRPIKRAEMNRYSVHKDCATYGRRILLDLHALNPEEGNFAQQEGTLEAWLHIAEDEIEGYRTAYRALTGVDLGASGTPKIEQRA